jgi:hypothetical protein
MSQQDIYTRYPTTGIPLYTAYPYSHRIRYTYINFIAYILSYLYLHSSPFGHIVDIQWDNIYEQEIHVT